MLRVFQAKNGFAKIIRSRLLTVCCLSVLFFISSGVAAADEAPGGNLSDATVKAVDIAKPSVVRIETLYKGTLVLSLPGFRSVTLGPQDVAGLGSGSFISSHGDILTADHVVNFSQSDLDTALISELADQITPVINSWLQSQGQPGVSSDTAQSLLLNNPSLFRTTYSKPETDVFLSTDYTGPLSQTSLSSVNHLHATILRESSFDHDDIAIIHVDPSQANIPDTPSITLGDSNQVQVQDQLTMIGFPGTADINDNPTNFLSSSISQITISSKKTDNNGSTLIQVSGNVEHGDSGGPALANDGTIIGIVSFALSDTGDTRFLRASDTAENLIQQAGIDVKPGKFQTEWAQAFNDYASTAPGHYHKALTEFQSIHSNYPSFGALQPFLTFTQQQAALEKVPQATSTSKSSPIAIQLAVSLFIALLVILAIVVVVIFIFMRNRRSRRNRLAVAGLLNDFHSQPPVSSYSNTPQSPPNLSNQQWSMSNTQTQAIPPFQMQPGQQLSGLSSSPTGPSQMLCMNGHVIPAGFGQCTVCGAEPRNNQSLPPSSFDPFR